MKKGPTMSSSTKMWGILAGAFTASCASCAKMPKKRGVLDVQRGEGWMYTHPSGTQ